MWHGRRFSKLVILHCGPNPGERHKVMHGNGHAQVCAEMRRPHKVKVVQSVAPLTVRREHRRERGKKMRPGEEGRKRVEGV